VWAFLLVFTLSEYRLLYPNWGGWLVGQTSDMTVLPGHDKNDADARKTAVKTAVHENKARDVRETSVNVHVKQVLRANIKQ
jgi:hypothetical protein